MSKRNKELRGQYDTLNEDAESVVERHPRSNFPFLLIFVCVVIFMLFTYLSSNNFEVQNVIDATLPTQTASDEITIHQFISNGTLDELKQRNLLTDGETINEVVGGMTPVMLAASLGNVGFVELLFRHGADPNIRGSAQRTALQYATEKNHIEVAKRLLTYGADIDAYDNGRLTPLIMAADRGYTELGLLYIEKGANVNIQHVQGWTALIDAVAKNDTRLVNALLAAGADKELAASNGMKAIDYARQYGYKNMEKILGRHR